MENKHDRCINFRLDYEYVLDGIIRHQATF